MPTTQQIKKTVRDRYAQIALRDESCCGSEASSCCDASVTAEAEGDLGLGCGLPTTFADLQPGETVLDLGSGAGVDVFYAARAVGIEGSVIGVDMTPEMINRARTSAEQGSYGNVEFRLGDIQHLPLDDSSIDVALSNCVINLAPDKRQVFAEIHRVLREGGRFAISDIVTIGEVPDDVRNDADLWAGCLAGALDRAEYLAIIDDAGFVDIRVATESSWREPGVDFTTASITVTARKG
jgi:SAM-dependent methyltransferase